MKHGAVPEEKDAETWAQPPAWARKMGHNEIVSVLILQSGSMGDKGTASQLSG
jgi:hypothetical protein